jgi:hypothetical protein
MTIAQELKITEFPFIIKDSNGKEIYYEGSNGYWQKREYDKNGRMIYRKDSDGFWEMYQYTSSDGKKFCYENSKGFWSKCEMNDEGDMIYIHNSAGLIVDHRPKSEVQKAIELLTKEGLLIDGKILKV